MTYNLHGPSLALTPDERAGEARKLLGLLRGEQSQGTALARRLTPSAMTFVENSWMELDLWRKVAVTEAQLLFLRDIWQKFA